MALCFAYQFTVLLPHAGIGWQAHIGGLAGGILAGWLFRDRRATRAATADSPAAVTPGAPGTAITGKKPATGKSADVYGGSRADLHRQLDDLGL
jgi:hypothetical protein